MLRPVCFVLLVFLVVFRSAAADWPQFRGPEGDGHAEARNLPTTWNETTNVAWKAEIPGKGWSSPSLFKNRLYLTTAVPIDAAAADSLQSLQTMCVDAASGRIVWSAEVFRQTEEPAIHSKNSHASPTPLVRDDRVFVHFGPDGTACLDLAGNIIWKNQLH